MVERGTIPPAHKNFQQTLDKLKKMVYPIRAIKKNRSVLTCDFRMKQVNTKQIPVLGYFVCIFGVNGFSFTLF